MSEMLRVTTESGSVYLLDSRKRTAVRLKGADADSLRADGVPMAWTGSAPIVVGDSMTLTLDIVPGVMTLRSTTPVISIEDVSDDSA